MRLVQLSNFLLASSGSSGVENPGEVVVEHLSDSVIHGGPIGYLNTHFLSEKLFGIFDMRITGVVLMMWLSLILCLAVFIPLARSMRKAHKGSSSRWVNIWEMLIEYIRDEVIRPNFHEKTSAVLPYFLTLFFFIFFCNLIGLIPSMHVGWFPGFRAATGNLAVTGALAVITLILMCVIGFIKHGPLWIVTGIVPHGLPKGIYVLLWPIELISLFMKPFVLMIRLFANMLAGHLVILVFVLLILIFQNFFVAFGSVPMNIFMFALELLVGFIQAYVFTMLTAIFIASSIESH
jgi:F-type H+-transporting ATPase subunit a